MKALKAIQASEEAMQAFLDNYLLILRKAFIDTNYGADQFISLVEILLHEAGDCIKNVSTVFIRPETLYEFDGDMAATIQAIVKLAKSYPVLYISNDRYRFSLSINKSTNLIGAAWNGIQLRKKPCSISSFFFRSYIIQEIFISKKAKR